MRASKIDASESLRGVRHSCLALGGVIFVERNIKILYEIVYISYTGLVSELHNGKKIQHRSVLGSQYYSVVYQEVVMITIN